MPNSPKAYRNIDLTFEDEDLPSKPVSETIGVYDQKVDEAKKSPGTWKSLGGYPSRGNAQSAANGLRRGRYGHPEVDGLHFTVRKVDPNLLPDEAQDRPFVIFVRHLPNTIVEGERDRFVKDREQRRAAESKARAAKRKSGDNKPAAEAAREESQTAQATKTTKADMKAAEQKQSARANA